MGIGDAGERDTGPTASRPMPMGGPRRQKKLPRAVVHTKRRCQRFTQNNSPARRGKPMPCNDVGSDFAVGAGVAGSFLRFRRQNRERELRLHTTATGWCALPAGVCGRLRFRMADERAE